MNNRLQILESTLHWRHMTPTAPDTLSETVAQNTIMQHRPTVTKCLVHQIYSHYRQYTQCSDLVIG